MALPDGGAVGREMTPDDRLPSADPHGPPAADAGAPEGAEHVARPARRTVLRGAAATALLAPLSALPGAAALAGALASAGCASPTPAAGAHAGPAAAAAGPDVARGAAAGAATASPAAGPLIGFASIDPSTEDTVRVPPGYTAQVVGAWGDPVGHADGSPPFRFDAGNSADEQALQMGMHHDGMHYFALEGSRRGLLAVNHEYCDLGLLYPDGPGAGSAEKVRKSQAAHGVSVVEVAERDGRWHVVRPSRHARRITAATPMGVGGPAAGHPLLRTAADPEGRRILGTFANCAAGGTPWGTYLTCEENFAGYFRGPPQPDAELARWGVRPGERYGYRWAEHDERFDLARHPHEFHRFGWVVEIDPFDAAAAPVKRTALGRFEHEGATTVLTKDGRAVVYMGDDDRFAPIFKFVSRDRVRAGGARANAALLDHGTLYAARFDADGRGRWLPLVHGEGPLTAAEGFADQGEVVVRARQAAARLGATPMDRPEWIAVDREGRVYCALTNNADRGAPGQPGPDAANPRAGNTMGHILRWREDGDPDAVTLRWAHFVLAGDPANPREDARGSVDGDAFACPDGLFVDARGVLWIQTDMSPSLMGRGDAQRLGHNAMLAADPHSGRVRRFLTGPAGCEITGATGTPDGRTLFVNVQHPGEISGGGTDPAQPRRGSNWPDHRADGRPRSATLAIRRSDGAPVGT